MSSAIRLKKGACRRDMGFFKSSLRVAPPNSSKYFKNRIVSSYSLVDNHCELSMERGDIVRIVAVL